MYLGKNIKFLRKGKGLNQKELGEILGVTGTQVSGYEKENTYPKFEGLLKLSELFNILLDDLINIDLESEQGRPAAALPKNEAEQDKMINALNDLLMKRVMQMEEEIKKMDPERARELGIE